jgi:hypothetical protein
MSDWKRCVIVVRRDYLLFPSPEANDRVLGEFDSSTWNSGGPIKGDQGKKVLQEMNELGEAQEHIRRESFPKVSVY